MPVPLACKAVNVLSKAVVPVDKSGREALCGAENVDCMLPLGEAVGEEVAVDAALALPEKEALVLGVLLLLPLALPLPLPLPLPGALLLPLPLLLG